MKDEKRIDEINDKTYGINGKFIKEKIKVFNKLEKRHQLLSETTEGKINVIL